MNNTFIIPGSHGPWEQYEGKPYKSPHNLLYEYGAPGQKTMLRKYGSIQRGTSIKIPVVFNDSKGEPVDLTDFKIRFTLKKALSDYNFTDDRAFITKDFDPQDPENGRFDINLTSHDTYIPSTRYCFDIELVSSGGAVARPVTLLVDVIGGPTNRTVNNGTDQFLVNDEILVQLVEGQPIVIISPATIIGGGGDFTALEARVTTLETEVDNLDSTINIISGEIDDLETNISTMQDEIDDLTTDIGLLDGRVDVVESDIVAIETDIVAIEIDIAGLGGEIDALESDIGDLTNTVDDLETDLSALESRVDVTESDIDAIETAVDDLDTKVDDLADEVGDIGAVLDMINRVVI